MLRDEPYRAAVPRPLQANDRVGRYKLYEASSTTHSRPVLSFTTVRQR